MNMDSKKVDVSVFQKAKKGNVCCGDSYFYLETENELVCAVADGLGSGEFARESSQVVIDIIRENIHISMEDLIKKSNKHLYGKRGVVLGVLKLDFLKKQYTYSSIGNVGLITVSMAGRKKRSIPNTGYLAGYHQPFKAMQEGLDTEMTFIMFTDGVSEKDLQQGLLFYKDVADITSTYMCICDDAKDDDTTLIAMRYKACQDGRYAD